MSRPDGADMVRCAEFYRDARKALDHAVDASNAAIGRVSDAEQEYLGKRCARLSAEYDRRWNLMLGLFKAKS